MFRLRDFRRSHVELPMAARIKLLDDAATAFHPVAPSCRSPTARFHPIVAQPHLYHIRHFDFVVRNIPQRNCGPTLAPSLNVGGCTHFTSPIRRSASIRKFPFRNGDYRT